MQQQPLTGITVLDFGQVYNGPYCGFLLAQAGARVIKVESLMGETLRARGATTASTYPFNSLNTNKECIAINLKTDRGCELIRQLAAHVDVITQNFAPGTLEKFGLGPEALRQINPRLVYAMSTGYGASDGPYRDYLGMDITLQAMVGAMSVTGEADGPPLKTPAAYTDFLAGTHLYSGIVTALFAREKTGEGATVDISMQDCALPTLATAIGSFYTEGRPLPRNGSRHPNSALAPYNVYEAQDGHIALICIREGHWRKLCHAMGEPGLADDPRYATMEDRSARIDEVDDLVNHWSRKRSRQEITEICQQHGVISAPVQTIPEALEDPQMLARGSLQKRELPGIGSVSQFQTPLRFADLDPPALRDVPELGADTRQVLMDLLALTDDEIQSLLAADIIA